MTNVVDLAHHSAEGIRISQHDRFSLGHPSSVAKTLTTSAAPGTTSISRPIHYTQRAQHIPETTNVVLEQPGGETVAVQLAGADLAHLTSLGQEIIGELDPETGIFYTTAPGGQETAVTIVTTTQPQQMATHQVVQRHQTVVAAPKENATGIMTMSQAGIGAVSQQPLQQLPAAITTKPIDFLSSALNQAQIDLDPYQFIDEDEPAFSTTKLASTPTVSVCAEAESSSQAAHQGQQLMTLFTPDSGTVNMATQQTIHSQDVTLGLSTDEVAVTGSASSLSMGMSVTQKHEQQDPMILLQQTPSTTTISPPPQQQPDNPQIELAHIQTPIQHKQQIHVQQQSRQIHALQHQPHIKVSTIANTRPIVSIATTTRTVAPTLAATRPAVSSLVTTCPVVSTLASMRSMVSTSVPVELPTLVPSTTEVFAPTTIHQAQLQVTPTLTLLQQAPVVSTIDAQVTATVDISPYEDPVSTSVHVSDEVPSSTTEGIVMDGGPSLTHHEGEVLEEMVVSDGIIEFEQHEVCVPDTASNVTVAVEPGGLDTTTMVIEDFTSQQLITETSDHQTQAAHHQSGKMITIEYQTHDDGSHISDTGPISPSSGIAGTSEGQVSSGGEGGDSGLSSPVRASQRKRRPPSMPDDSPPHGHGNMSSWVRHASSLLQKVSKYRGSRKEKGELNASAWFLAPVDPKEVPDYYTIIKKPMDFGTIRHKLETSQYTSWEDFHTDMLLVQENCRRYNPPGHEIRKDCDEVFSFYTLEYEWGRDKWQKMHLSPTHKKPRLDRSPMRT